MSLQKSMGLMALAAAMGGGGMYSPMSVSRERDNLKRKINHAGKKRPFKGSKAAKKASRKK